MERAALVNLFHQLADQKRLSLQRWVSQPCSGIRGKGGECADRVVQSRVTVICIVDGVILVISVASLEVVSFGTATRQRPIRKT